MRSGRFSGESSFSLIRRAKGGDAGALDELFGRHIAALRRWARGRLPRWARDGVDTQDIVQESVFRVSRNLESFDPKRQGALQAYLRQAVMNRIRDEMRRSRRAPPASELDSGVVDQQPSPLETAIGGDLQDRYERALARLDEDERQLIVARVELGYSYAQIAMALGKPSADAARMAITRTLLKLAAAMESA